MHQYNVVFTVIALKRKKSPGPDQGLTLSGCDVIKNLLLGRKSVLLIKHLQNFPIDCNGIEARSGKAVPLARPSLHLQVTSDNSLVDL